jgi:1,4-dihydroxy-2-naphthoyl-CoA hydrolase
MGSSDPVPLEIGLHQQLDIRTVEAGPDRVVYSLDVSPRHHQPMGLMHGGISALMAESAASMGAYLSVAPESHGIGVDLNITHLRAMRAGTVTATATPLRKGRTVHVWNIQLADGDGRLVAVGRCTLAIRPITKPGGEPEP